MDNSNIVLIKLYCGDYIIGEVSDTEVEPGFTILKNPRMFVMVPTMSGDVRAGFQPVCLFSEDVKNHISIRNEQIMATVKSDEIGKELINGYNSHITGIKIATASETAALNGGGGDLII